MKLNRFVKVNEAMGHLKVGQVVITNADDVDLQPEYFKGTITSINSETISVKRSDNIEGGAENGDWEISINNTVADIMIFSESAIVEKPANLLRFGHIILADSRLYIYLGKNHVGEGIFKQFLETEGITPTIHFSLGGDYQVVAKLPIVHCSEIGCIEPATRVVSGRLLCENHIDALGGAINCHHCGSLIFASEAHTASRSRHFCTTCWTELRNSEKVIKDYNYKPRPIFIQVNERDTEAFGKLFMGIEQEVECPSRVPSDAMVEEDESVHDEGVAGEFGRIVINKFFEPKKWFYLKHDGSLSRGFELVTHPATLKGHYSLPWRELCDLYKTLKITSDTTSTCGLHIHASKNILNQDHQIRLGYFIATHGHEVEIIARRGSCHYARHKDPDGNMLTMNQNESGGKYDALNWLPPQTVEFRLFKGTVVYETLIAALEFVHSVIGFTAVTSLQKLKDHAHSWASYLNYVDTNNYVTLKKYLSEKGFNI